MDRQMEHNHKMKKCPLKGHFLLSGQSEFLSFRFDHSNSCLQNGGYHRRPD